MSEPFYIAQATLHTRDELHAWVKESRVDAQRGRPTKIGRVTFHHSIADLYLIEFWDHVPEDQGAPRWSIVQTVLTPAP